MIDKENAMPDYIVQHTHIKHGTKGSKEAEVYAPGDTIPLTEKEAAMLGSNVKPAEANADQNRLEAIAAAIEQLDKNNPDLWTNDHKPQVKAIEEITGFDITAGQRDEAWESVG